MKEMDKNYREYLVQGKRAIPGQSLTNDPNAPLPFEKAPQFTNLRDAIEFIFVKLTDEAVYVPMMQHVADGVPVMELVQLMLFEGFNQGKWNPDLMMLLAEPATYMIMALAERAGISDYKIYIGEEEEEAAEAEVLGKKVDNDVIAKIKRAKAKRQLPAGVLPKAIVEQIEQMPEPSLMEQPVESLLGGEQ
jgi:hypothetical protein